MFYSLTVTLRKIEIICINSKLCKWKYMLPWNPQSKKVRKEKNGKEQQINNGK